MFTGIGAPFKSGAGSECAWQVHWEQCFLSRMNINAENLQAGQDEHLLFCLFKHLQLQENVAEKRADLVV